MTRLLGPLGVVLILGGLGHSAGVILFYVTSGVPDANRVLLDVWIAEAHILGGALYLAAFRSSRSGRAWRALSIFGTLTIIAFAVPMLPVLFLRAPVIFSLPMAVYLILSVFILVQTARSPRVLAAEPADVV